MTPETLYNYNPTVPDLAQLVQAAIVGYKKALTDYNLDSVVPDDLKILSSVLPDILAKQRFRTPLAFYWVHSWIDYKSSDPTPANKHIACFALCKYILNEPLPNPLAQEIEVAFRDRDPYNLKQSFIAYLLKDANKEVAR